jgi:hypothetical protein
VFILGLYGDSYLHREAGSELENLGNLELEALVGYRSSLPWGGYLSLDSGIGINDYFDNLEELNDEETFWLELSLPVWNSNRFVVETGFDSSLLGTSNMSPHFYPAWVLSWHFGEINSVFQPYIAYQGSYLFMPSDDEDVFFEGGELGVLVVPSITFEAEFIIGAGWEGWYEYPIYGSGGEITSDTRHDVVLHLSGEVRGMLEYFVDYTLGVSSVVRLSNANRYLSATGELDENSASRLELKEEAGLIWSPNRYLNFMGSVYGIQEVFFHREALNGDYSPYGQILRVYLVGGKVKTDWTPNDVVYFLFETSGGYSFANDPEEEYWYLNFRVGVELSY